MRNAILAIAATTALISPAMMFWPIDMASDPVVAEVPEFMEENGPVVLELFTSQSCSSCPPADALAEELALQEGVVVISRPVTYWNRIGWNDTLSQEGNSDLQRAYAERGLTGRNGVYTPQAVINGRSGVVGSRERDINTLLNNESGRERPVIALAGGRQVDVSGDVTRLAQLSVIALDASETVAIGSGENRNRTVTYTNVFLSEMPLGTFAGGSESFALPLALPEAGRADRHVLVLREASDDGAGQILAARWLS